MSESKTHWKKTFNPNYLGTYAFQPDEDIIGTIKTVKKEQVTNPSGEKDECTIIYFVEDLKPLILNKTNAKQIQNIHGTPYIEEWEGKQIQMYVKDKIKAFGSLTTGLRIRPVAPSKSKPELTPDHNKWAGAVENVALEKTTIKAIRKHYTLDEEMKAVLLDDVSDYLESKEKEVA